MGQRKKIYAEFFYQRTDFDVSSRLIEVESSEISKVDIPKNVFAVRFSKVIVTEREGREIDMGKKELVSRYFLGSEICAAEEFKKRFPDEKEVVGTVKYVICNDGKPRPFPEGSRLLIQSAVAV